MVVSAPGVIVRRVERPRFAKANKVAFEQLWRAFLPISTNNYTAVLTTL
jgi:hypothetical protein